MKKLALLLAALGVVSAAAYAAPELTVTSVGQEIEIENEDHNGTDLDDVWLFNNVGLAYGDWSFGLQAGKQWGVNFDDGDNGKEKGVKSEDSRLQIDVWKKVTDDLKLGFRYRGHKNYDRYYARWDYSHGMFWSSGDVWYEATNGSGLTKMTDKVDWVKSEFFPIGLKYGAFKVGYFINYNKAVGSMEESQQEDYFEHQIRAYATLYKGEKVTLTTEGRFTISAENGYNGADAADYRHYDDFGRNRIYLGLDYQATENLKTYIKYGYEFRDWKVEGKDANDHKANAYQYFIVGWSYKF